MPRPKRPAPTPVTPVSIPVGPRAIDALLVAHRCGLPALLIGDTGIGKSEIVVQAARSKGIDSTTLDLSLLEPPDLVGLPVIADNVTRYATPSILPRSGAGILMLEELNRADPSLLSCALQLLSARRLHEYELPPGWTVCAAINPEGSGYDVNRLDPAMITRFVVLRLHADPISWILWARQNGIHPVIVSLAGLHDDFLKEVPPRTWTRASTILKGASPGELSNRTLMADLLGGLLPLPWVEALLQDMARLEVDASIDPYCLLAEYRGSNELQGLIRQLRASGRTDRLARISSQVESIVKGPELGKLIDEKSFDLESFEKLLDDLPGDHRERIGEAIGLNSIAARLVTVRPQDVLREYRGGPIEKKVAGWLRGGAKRYRVAVLLGSIQRFVEGHSNIFNFRMDRHAMACLGRLLEQVGPDLGQRLMPTLRRWNLEPIYPNAGR